MEFAVNYLSYILMFSTIQYQICLGLEWPRIVVNEGQTAKVPCPTQGSSVSYFWKSGLFYNNSDIVALLVHGIMQQSSEGFDLTYDGTLLIHNISTRQQGRYFCRTTSTSNECHGVVTVYVKALDTQTRIRIDECSPQSSCTLFLALHATMTLTCTAENMPSGTKLIWLNGSQQLGSHKSETVNCGAVGGKDANICNTIEFVFDFPVGLNCLVLSELSRPEDTPAMIASVTLVEEGDPLQFAWILAVAVLLTIFLTIFSCFIIYTFVRCIKARSSKETSGTNSNRDDRKQKENATVTSDETELDPLIQETNTIRKDESSKGVRKIPVDKEKHAEAKSKESKNQDIELSKETKSSTEIVMTPPTAPFHPHPSSVTTENESVSTSSASTKQHKLVESKPEKSESQGLELKTEIKPSTKTITTPPTAPKHVTTEKESGSTSLASTTQHKLVESKPEKGVQKAQVNESPVDSLPEQMSNAILVNSLSIEFQEFPERMRQFARCLRYLYAENTVDSSADKATGINKIRDQTRQDAIVYVKGIMPMSTKVVRFIQDFFEVYEGLKTEEWTQFLPEFLEDVTGFQLCCIEIVRMHEEMMTRLKKREDEAKVLLFELKDLNKEIKKYNSVLKDAAAITKAWAFGFPFTPTVHQITINEAAIVVVSKALVPAISNFIDGLHALASFFHTSKEELTSLHTQGEKAVGGKRLHYIMMKKKAVEVKRICKDAYATITGVRSDLQCIPESPFDQNHVDKWLTTQQQHIRRKYPGKLKGQLQKMLKECESTEEVQQLATKK